jgi:hypothetical protein
MAAAGGPYSTSDLLRDVVAMKGRTDVSKDKKKAVVEESWNALNAWIDFQIRGGRVRWRFNDDRRT